MISVLLIEDDVSLLELTREYLEINGTIAADTAQSAGEALVKIGRRNYDAVVSDYLMPDMDGITLLKNLRSADIRVPFIIFTGKSQEQVVIEALNNGADFFLQKGGEPKTRFAELENMIMQAVSRRKAEEGLRESIRRLYDIINFIPDATFAIDRDGRVVAWNRAIEEMTGVTAQKMLGKEDNEYSLAFYATKRPLLIDMIFSPSEEVVFWGYTSVKKKGVAIEAETVFTNPEGKTLSLWATAAPLFDENGALAGAIESVRDITGQKAAKEAGRLNESRFRSIFEHSPLAIAVFDETGKFVEMNRACYAMLGINAEALWQDFNLFRSRMIPPSVQGTIAKRGTARFRVPPSSPGIRAEGAVFPPLDLDIMVIPVMDRPEMPARGFIMQFREVGGGHEAVQTVVS